MMFFRRAEIPVRCPFRSAVAAAPKPDRLLAVCAESQRGRLRRRLARIAPEDRQWSVHWRKGSGDELRPQDVVAALVLGGIVVELVSLRHGTLTELLAAEGDRVDPGTALAKIAPPVKAVSQTQKRDALLAQFTARHIRDLQEIEGLRGQIGQLRGEILSLRGRQNAEYLGARLAQAPTDRKFRRLKQEFSKHFHPDAHAADDRERRRRERVFQEFWPVVERIERS